MGGKRYILAAAMFAAVPLGCASHDPLARENVPPPAYYDARDVYTAPQTPPATADAGKYDTGDYVMPDRSVTAAGNGPDAQTYGGAVSPGYPDSAVSSEEIARDSYYDSEPYVYGGPIYDPDLFIYNNGFYGRDRLRYDHDHRYDRDHGYFVRRDDPRDDHRNDNRYPRDGRGNDARDNDHRHDDHSDRDDHSSPHVDAPRPPADNHPADRAHPTREEQQPSSLQGNAAIAARRAQEDRAAAQARDAQQSHPADHTREPAHDQPRQDLPKQHDGPSHDADQHANSDPKPSHNDVPRNDSHSDSHADSSHGDSSHNDAPKNSGSSPNHH